MMALVNYILICIAKPKFILNEDDFELIFRKLSLENVHEVYNQQNLVKIFNCSSASIVKEKELAREARAISEMLNNLEINIVEETRYRHPKKLILFDLDSTLILQETIDMVAELSMNKSKINQISKLARSGEIDFKEAIEKRVELMKGISIENVKRLLSNLILANGAKEMIHYLKKCGIHVGIVSGSFLVFAEHIANMLNIEFVFANKVLFLCLIVD